MNIWFWQRMVTPHMSGLAGALASRGHSVTYVAEQPMSSVRAREGWSVPEVKGVTTLYASSDDAVAAAVEDAPGDSIHICQGLRANGRVAVAQRLLAARGIRQWIILETVDDSGALGVVKRSVYRRGFMRALPAIEGVLAIGARTPWWVERRGVPRERTYPFAYFLDVPTGSATFEPEDRRGYTFIYAGRLTQAKGFDLLLDALARVRAECQLVVIGDGPQAALLERGSCRMDGRVSVEWLGRLSMSQTQEQIAMADCLVLPSRYDGWGAVVSEAMLVGTPVICSDACGSSVVVRASGSGGVFRSGDASDLSDLMYRFHGQGPVTAAQRDHLRRWSERLSANCGATYLEQILASRASNAARPSAPWEDAEQ